MIDASDMADAIRSIAIVVRANSELFEALEMMVQQYMHYERTGPEDDGEGYYSHDFMSTGEYLAELMPRIRPDRWRSNGLGLVPLFHHHYTTMEEFERDREEAEPGEQ